MAAVKVLPGLVRRLPRLGTRLDIAGRLAREWGCGRSCHNRITYCDLAEAFLTTFSRRFFRDHLLEPMLDLLDDPVVNVRLRACRLLPQLKRTLRLPEDTAVLERLSKVRSLSLSHKL